MQLVKLIDVLNFRHVIDQFVLPVCHRFLGLLAGFEILVTIVESDLMG